MPFRSCGTIGVFIMSNFKHLDLSDRIIIEQGLLEGLSFKMIAARIQKHCSTVSQEVRKHSSAQKTGGYGRRFNDCRKRFECRYRDLCKGKSECRTKFCRFCSRCSSVCLDYVEESCYKLLKPPYICNGCPGLKKCTLKKLIYRASSAQELYAEKLRISRSGITADEEEIRRIDEIITPLIKRGQSIYHICFNNRDIIMRSERTIYKYVEYGLLQARNIDLPRKVGYRPRRRRTDNFKVDKKCRIGRGYTEFMGFMEENSDTPLVEIDTVEGRLGGKVLLTICFLDSMLMIAYIRDSNTSRSVTEIFEDLFEKLGRDLFLNLFPVILTDNGSEFSNPAAIEFEKTGSRRTRVFYCDPSSPYQKGAIENKHALMRRIIPKGKSLDRLSQSDIQLMMDHLNSYRRRKLNDKSPYETFSFLHGTDAFERLGFSPIPEGMIMLTPELLK